MITGMPLKEGWIMFESSERIRPTRRWICFSRRNREKNADRILKAKWKDGLRPLIGLHPTGSGSYKWWPKEYFATLAQALIERHQARLVIFSSRKEAAVARSIAENLGEDVLLAEGQYDLLDVAALMKKCRLFVANDSGLLHMALALEIPTLALIGADSPLRIGPYQVSNSACLYKKEEVCQELRCLNQGCRDNRCLKAISPEEVLAVIENRFKENLLNPNDPRDVTSMKNCFRRTMNAERHFRIRIKVNRHVEKRPLEEKDGFISVLVFGTMDPFCPGGLKDFSESFPFFPSLGPYYRGPGDHPWPGGLFLGPSDGFKQADPLAQDTHRLAFDFLAGLCLCFASLGGQSGVQF